MSWPSRFGKLGEKIFGEDDPFNESSSNALNRFSTDEMPPTRSPVTGRYYTSKSKLRAEYKAHGVEEVGTAYENGYDPQISRERERERTFNERLHERLRRVVNRG